MAERPAGSKRGRPSIDWEKAFAYYASLSDAERSYRAVAEHFGVSVRTVEAHGRNGHWRERLAEIRALAAEETNERVAQERADKVAQFLLLADATLTSYAQQLRAGTVKVSPSDVLRLYKLCEELWANDDAHRLNQVAVGVRELDTDDPEERKHDLVAALIEAGAFERLRNLVAEPPGPDAPDPDAEPADTHVPQGEGPRARADDIDELAESSDAEAA